MLTTLAALVVALACAIASARRVAYAVAPTALDPETLVRALRGDAGRARFSSVVAAVVTLPEAEWEHALFSAARAPDDVRAALVNEQLTEFDYLARRWERVPRVCASIASTTGFLLAAVALRSGLEDPAALAFETRGLVIHTALNNAVNVAAIGVAGAAFCIAAQFRARRAARVRLEAIDKLIDRLEALSAPRDLRHAI